MWFSVDLYLEFVDISVINGRLHILVMKSGFCSNLAGKSDIMFGVF